MAIPYRQSTILTATTHAHHKAAESVENRGNTKHRPFQAAIFDSFGVGANQEQAQLRLNELSTPQAQGSVRTKGIHQKR
jgi:hypothetical protein